MLDRVAIISDVHGNVTALQAVLADIQARGISRIVTLGDVIGKGPRGSEAVRLVGAACEVTVRGNWDTSIARQTSHNSPSGQWTRDELSAGDLAWLAALPGTLSYWSAAAGSACSMPRRPASTPGAGFATRTRSFPACSATPASPARSGPATPLSPTRRPTSSATATSTLPTSRSAAGRRCSTS